MSRPLRPIGTHGTAKRFRRLLMLSVLLLLLSGASPFGATMAQAPAAGGWQIQRADTGGDVGKYTSLALDGYGRPHISYYDDTTDDLKYTRWNGAAWQNETVDSSGQVGRYSSLVLDSSDYPHISYNYVTGGRVKYASWDGSAWTRSNVTGSMYAGLWTSLAIDGNDNVHLSYYSDYTLTNPIQNHLKYRKRTGTSWASTVTVDLGTRAGQYSSISVDGNGNPHIAYYDDFNDNLKYAYYDGSWHKEAVDSAGDVGSYSSLALDSAGRPHISYFDYDHKTLKYARWTGALWQIETVDNNGQVGSHTSIALDSAGRPHISYFDLDHKTLKYAQWTGTRWEIETVDTDGSVGQYTSLALDGDDNPHISYYDSLADDLKYATKAGNGPSPAREAYLPLIMRNAGGSPAPTATPTETMVPTCTPTATTTGPTSTPTATVPASGNVIASMDFEGAFPGDWIVFDANDGTDGEYYWAPSDCQVYGGTYSGWAIGGGADGAGLSCGDNYPDDATSWLAYGPFSLIDATSAQLHYRLKTNSENNFDTLCRYASINGINWYGACTSGQMAGWEERTLDLSDVYSLGNLMGQSSVWVALVFASDGTIHYPNGAFVDDIVLTKNSAASGQVDMAGGMQDQPASTVFALP